MSSSELRWHEQFNATNLENALAARAREGKDIDRQWATKKLWDNETRPTPEQAAAIGEAVEIFLQTYPQVIRGPENHHSILVWLKDRNMEVTFSNLVESFQANALEGKIWLNPNAIGAGSQTEVTDSELTTHHNFHLLIQPQQRMCEPDRLSADEYLAKNTALHDTRLPPIIIS